MINNKSRLSPNAQIFFNKKFNIIHIFDLGLIDHDFDILKQHLQKTKKKQYQPDDKYLIMHYDTDYYLPGCSYGLSIYNLIKTFVESDIPFSTILFITNHVGIKQEFLTLIPKLEHRYNFPTIVDNCVTCLTSASIASSSAIDIPLNTSKINKNAICMLGVQRPHRNVIFNFIKKNRLLDKIATAYNNN
jgi:hypothetical protein